MSYAQADSRKMVRFTALGELLHTASKVPHTWTKEMIEVCVRREGREVGGRERETKGGRKESYVTNPVPLSLSMYLSLCLALEVDHLDQYRLRKGTLK